MTNLAALLNTWQQRNAHHVMSRALGAHKVAPSGTALDALRSSHELVKLLTSWRWQAVHGARREGAIWREIAHATQTTAEAARSSLLAAVEH